MSDHTDAAPRSELSKPIAVVKDVSEPVAKGAVHVLTKPRLRGWIHVYCAGGAVIAGAALVAVSWAVHSRRAGLATLAYVAATVAMFTVSAVYHRVHWQSATIRARMKRLDHSMIFVFIAGSYTPFARLAMPHATEHVVLAIVWGGALAGIALTVFWPTAPRWVGVPLYLLLGWVAVWYTGLILRNAGVAAMVLLAVGGVLYSVGAVSYALSARPVAVDVWLSRSFPCLHRSRGDLPLHRHVVRGLLKHPEFGGH